MAWPHANRWAGEIAVVMASGPSMTHEQADYCRARARVITVNTTFRMARWADVHYSNDDDWFRAKPDHGRYASHLDEIRATCLGEPWTGHTEIAHAIGLNLCPFNKTLPGLSRTPGVIAWGMNSGAAAIGLAHQFGVGRIVLLGFDQQWTGDRPRWHGRHPGRLQNQKPGFDRWSTWFQQAAKDFDHLGVEVINATPTTSLGMFRKASLAEALRC